MFYLYEFYMIYFIKGLCYILITFSTFMDAALLY